MPDRPRRKTVRHFNEPGQAHELTFSTHRRLPLLDRDRVRAWLVEALNVARRKHGFQLWAYVIMPEHVHVLLMPMGASYSVSAILKSIKQSVSRRAINWLKEHVPAFVDQLRVERPSGRIEYRFWQQGPGYDRNILDASTAWNVVNYLHENPVRRGLVEKATDWIFSSARQYAGLDVVGLEMDGRPPDLPPCP